MLCDREVCVINVHVMYAEIQNIMYVAHLKAFIFYFQGIVMFIYISIKIFKVSFFWSNKSGSFY